MYKFVFYVPEDYVEIVKAAVFKAGAGRIGDYGQCCWQVLGEGQFRPLAGSIPFIGDAPTATEESKLEKVPEYRVELVCADDCIQAAVDAFKQAHPYEEPAYDVWLLADF